MEPWSVWITHPPSANTLWITHIEWSLKLWRYVIHTDFGWYTCKKTIINYQFNHFSAYPKIKLCCYWRWGMWQLWLRLGIHICSHYRQLPVIRRTKSQNLNVSRVVLYSSLKPGVKSRMRILLEHRRQCPYKHIWYTSQHIKFLHILLMWTILNPFHISTYG